MDVQSLARFGEQLRRLQEGHSQAEKLFLKQVWVIDGWTDRDPLFL
jgi:hypothetical protein